MPTAPLIYNDPRNAKLNGLFFRRLYRLCLPYWTRKDAWKSWLALALLLGSASGFAVLGGYLSQLTADTTNALVDKDQVYWRLMIWMSFVGLLISGATLTTSLISTKLLLHWREWMTAKLMDDYLDKRTYYEIQKNDLLDNPDQRIQEEVAPFCQTMMGIPQYIFSSLTMLGVQAGVLMSISMSMFWAVIIYSVVNTLITLWLYHPLIKQYWNSTMANAELRSSLMHLRNNAENIAFYRGEKNERSTLQSRLNDLATAQMRIILYNLRISSVTEVMGKIFNLLPLIFIVPLYFQGEFQFGTIDQATAAAAMMLSGLSTINTFIPTLTQVVPTTVRLAEIQEKLQEVIAAAKKDSTSRISLGEAQTIRLNQVDIYTPQGEQLLVKDLSIGIEPGQHTVIIGQTGVGKSSLLRALAGLWTRGHGQIEMPSIEHLMFIPQRPYMILSDLRSQLLYPRIDDQVDDDRLYRAFASLGQADFIDQHDGLDSIKDWRRTLSLGEQQLVAFARIVLRQPRYLFLDEATSALDIQSEQRVYQCLSELGITFISVGHRESILPFHRQTLQLLAEGHWHVTQQSERALPSPALA
ncbi:putative ATP-binding cassette transporter [Pseudomonas cuatrocienegasensis]|uniref:ATP-binding cassette transporter n=1 Tax=Pseudomonas cuatrocienegasensis TaxID=543360 RepID=A0ABY1B9Y7_9PSED|nr:MULTISPECIES: ATP-binding cassette domain-containing protein [Pseudomonas]OEC35381.1 hypothetical protein A7D25_09700 [Pseudomonas sp. 21C1]SEQ34149.1 putative ATP-binding cassette transporter [Pseudomonas cuatrocienegasensis]